jgi:hypothetical protein
MPTLKPPKGGADRYVESRSRLAQSYCGPLRPPFLRAPCQRTGATGRLSPGACAGCHADASCVNGRYGAIERAASVAARQGMRSTGRAVRGRRGGASMLHTPGERSPRRQRRASEQRARRGMKPVRLDLRPEPGALDPKAGRRANQGCDGRCQAQGCWGVPIRIVESRTVR